MDGEREKSPSHLVRRTVVCKATWRSFTVHQPIWLADIHDVWHAQHLARAQTPLGVARKSLGKLEEVLRVGQAPIVNLACGRVAEAGRPQLVASVDEAWESLPRAIAECPVYVADGSKQLRAVGNGCIASLVRARSRR